MKAYMAEGRIGAHNQLLRIVALNGITAQIEDLEKAGMTKNSPLFKQYTEAQESFRGGNGDIELMEKLIIDVVGYRGHLVNEVDVSEICLN